MHKNKRTVGIENIPETKPKDPDIIPMLDEDYERSLINILPEGTAQWFRRVPEEWLLMQESELKELFYPEIDENGHQVTAEDFSHHKGGKRKSGRSTFHIDQQLRMAFWAEYDAAQNNQRKFIPRHVWMNIVHNATWYNSVLPNPQRLAWIMCPPGSYVAKTMEVYLCGLELMYEYLKLGVQTDNKGNIDSKLGAVQQKIFEGAGMRVRGSVPMNVMQKTLSFNVHKNADDSNPTSHGTKIEDLESELAKLRSQVVEQEQKQISVRSHDQPEISSSDGIIDVTPEKELVRESVHVEQD